MKSKLYPVMKELREQGLNYAQIGSRYGLTRQRVHQILKGYRTLQPEERKRLITELKPKKCGVCGKRASVKKLNIHHQDGNPQNNEPSNILFCHYHCHRKIEGWKPQREKNIFTYQAPKVAKICRHCGKELQVLVSSLRRREARVTCSSACFKASRWNSWESTYFVFDCQNCKKEFFITARDLASRVTNRNHHPKYCSPRCNVTHGHALLLARKKKSENTVARYKVIIEDRKKGMKHRELKEKYRVSSIVVSLAIRYGRKHGILPLKIRKT